MWVFQIYYLNVSYSNIKGGICINSFFWKSSNEPLYWQLYRPRWRESCLRVYSTNMFNPEKSDQKNSCQWKCLSLFYHDVYCVDWIFLCCNRHWPISCLPYWTAGNIPLTISKPKLSCSTCNCRGVVSHVSFRNRRFK